MREKFYTKTIAILSSRKFFYALIGLFVFQSAWIALSGLYSMSFDEDVHLSIIKLYAHKILPFWSHQPDGQAIYGAVTRDPSYLYHYLMSFPYRVIALFVHGQSAQVISLRLFSVAFFALGLVVYRQVLLHSKASPALIHTVLAFIVLTPLMPLIAAQINYDNLLFLLSGISLLLTLRFVSRLKKEHIFDIKLLTLLLVVCLLTSLVKYAFLPIFAAIVIWLAVSVYCSGKTTSKAAMLKQAGAAYRGLGRWSKIALIAGLLVSTGLFLERYGVNTVRYGTPIPECDQVLTIEACKANGPWLRNYLTESDKEEGKLPMFSHNPLNYTLATWAKTMFTHLFFTINGTKSGFKVGDPLPVPRLLAEIIGAVAAVLIVLYQKVLRRQYEIGLFILVALMYVMILWAQNYGDFLHIGYAFGIQGRYFLPILPLIYLFAALAFSRVLRNVPLAKAILTILVLSALALQGGGFMTFIIRSDPSWYWPNQAVIAVNQAAQKILKIFVVGS